jgi:hypothetical protein
LYFTDEETEALRYVKGRFKYKAHILDNCVANLKRHTASFCQNHWVSMKDTSFLSTSRVCFHHPCWN